MNKTLNFMKAFFGEAQDGENYPAWMRGMDWISMLLAGHRVKVMVIEGGSGRGAFLHLLMQVTGLSANDLPVIIRFERSEDSFLPRSAWLVRPPRGLDHSELLNDLLSELPAFKENLRSRLEHARYQHQLIR